jgi:hypothetical protein
VRGVGDLSFGVSASVSSSDSTVACCDNLLSKSLRVGADGTDIILRSFSVRDRLVQRRRRLSTCLSDTLRICAIDSMSVVKEY